MAPKHKIDRKRRRASRQEKVEKAYDSSDDEAPYDVKSDGSDEEEEAEVTTKSDNKDDGSHQAEDDEEEVSESDEEEPDNPDDEDFELNESSSQDDESEEEEDYEPETTVRRGRRATAANKRKSPRQRSRVAHHDDDESEASSDVSRARGTRNGRGRRARRAPDSSQEEDEYYSPNARSSRRPQRKAKTRRANYRDDSSSDSDEEHSPGRRSAPSRASAKRANKKLHETLCSDDSDDEEEANLPMLSPKKRKKRGSDEDEYQAGNHDEEDEDEALSAEDDNDSLVDENLRNVDNESIGSMDDSDDGNNAGPSPELQIRRPRRRRQQAALDSSDDDASIDAFPTSSATRKQSMVVTCPSTHDVITMDPLPEKHVCYITPDQKSRQCFALETLHKIAMTSQLNARKTFLQPPHFRSSMSDDLIDQIASRFGRAALDLHGYFYNPSKQPLSHDSEQSHEFDYITNFEGGLANTETFMERLNDYISNLMGSQDIYCCPLCYTEAYRSLMNPDQSGDDDSDQEDEQENEDNADDFTFNHDPMTILGSLDDDCFQLASTFCFTRIADVKRHLRDAHHVDTSVLDGNALFPRFKIRESDGLLQRYIDNCHWMAYQGSMRRYWNEGNNQMFIQLLHLMKRTQLLKKAAQDDPGNEHNTISDADKMILDDAEVFTRSFEKRAKRVWDRLSAPYRKADKKDIDFIAGDDDEEEDVSQPMFNHARETELTPEDQVIAELQKRRRRSGQFSQDESEEDASEHDEPSEESEEGSNYSEGSEEVPEDSSEDEEDDEWIQELKGRRKARGKHVAKARGKRLGKRKSARTPSSSIRSTAPATSSSRKHRRIAESDDDEYD